jgi:hypothetical protein
MSKKRRTKNKRERLQYVFGEADILYTTRKQSERRRDKKMAMEGVVLATLGTTKKRKEKKRTLEGKCYRMEERKFR